MSMSLRSYLVFGCSYPPGEYANEEDVTSGCTLDPLDPMVGNSDYVLFVTESLTRVLCDYPLEYELSVDLTELCSRPTDAYRENLAQGFKHFGLEPQEPRWFLWTYQG